MVSTRTIVILGGTGFVGTHLVARLVAEGYRVRVLSRHPHRHQSLGLYPSVELVKCDVFNPQQLRSSLNQSDVVINLIGILNESHQQNFRRTHVALPGKLVEICKQLKIPRLLHMSALNADSAAPSQYLRTKGEGENLLHTTSGGNLQTTSFRPSVIFGPGDSFLNRFSSLLKLVPGPFPLACANTKFAPVYVGDVIDSMVKSIDSPKSFGKRIELCGPQEYTLRSLVELTADCTRQHKKIVGLPKWASFTQAAVLGILPGKLFTLDNYRSMKVDSVCRERENGATAIESIVPGYLGSANHETKMQHFREDYSCFAARELHSLELARR